MLVNFVYFTLWKLTEFSLQVDFMRVGSLVFFVFTPILYQLICQYNSQVSG